MRVLGIDPGLAATGYGIIETDGSRHESVSFGVVHAPSRFAFHERLHRIHTGLTTVLSGEVIDAMAIEQIFYAANVKSALKLGHARGVALLVGAQLAVPVFEYSATQVKQSVVGYGRADKHQVGEMVRFLLRLQESPSPDDVTDALAVAICHSHTSSNVLQKIQSVQESG